MNHLEIERKWIVKGWPKLIPCLECEMWQGYISHHPTVRIRKMQSESISNYILCLKGKGTIARQEVEIEINADCFEDLKAFTGEDLIYKRHRRYQLDDGKILEVSEVDPGRKTAFFYAEIEYSSMAEAESWCPGAELEAYLSQEVSGLPGYSMGAYWKRTREKTQ